MEPSRFMPLLHPGEQAGKALAFEIRTGTGLVRDGDSDDVDAPICLGGLDDRPGWAVGIDGEPGAGSVPLMGLYGQVDEVTFTVAGRAVQLVEWERTHRFCGRCGTPTEAAAGERA